ncbi:MAG: Uma2 family endonuclease [Desulfobacteraceae bacterium]|nr:Uma2 family endonuclease [Desulfobacteraceae bacterium]
MQLLRSEEISEKPSYPGRFTKTAVPELRKKVIYPERDGKHKSDNTKQFNRIVKIKEGSEVLFADNPDVFVAGDLLWYPVEGSNKIRIAPDAMVAFGRPKGCRGSYRQWEEGNIVPQVVFGVLSPGNTPKEMKRKLGFYERYGVSEYYEYDPDRIVLKGWLRSENRLVPIGNMKWVSPILGIRFEIADDLVIFRPDGQKFLSPVEMEKRNVVSLHEVRSERHRAVQEKLRAQEAESEAEQERLRAEQEKLRAQMLEEKLKALEKLIRLQSESGKGVLT